MSIENVREYLKEFGVENEIMEFDVSSATAQMAAEAVGSTLGEIAKSLSFLVEDKPIIVVTSGDMKVNSGKFKKEFSTKPKMIPFEETEEYIGHKVGGICPFGVKDGAKIYLDISLKRYDHVYPACGSSNSAIKVTIPQLEEFSRFDRWVDTCKEIEG